MNEIFRSLAIFFIFLTLPIFAEEKRLTIEEFCKSEPCRKNYTIDLKQKDGTQFKKNFPLLPPVVQPSLISIYAGETVYLEARFTEAGPVDFVHVQKLTKPETTFVFKLEQQVSEAGVSHMLFTAKNPFSKDLRYKMEIMPLDKAELLKTSSCPVIAGGGAFESWPYPIFSVALDGFRFLNPGESRDCVE